MFITYIVNSVLVALAVLIHYEMLYRMSVWIPKLRIRYRFRVLFGIFGALIAHVMEIWLFAFGYHFMIRAEIFGTLNGNFTNTVLDCVYYSFVSYTSLGLGDIVPTQDLRFLTGLESLTGLVLITWTASFLFIEMRKFWDNR